MGRILVVDDEPLIALLVQEWLAEMSCDVVGPALSVKSALSLMDAVELDGAIVDVSLGGESSFAVADRLTERGVPFAFATGYADDEVSARFPGAPILRKPFTLDDVRAAVATFRDRAPS
ncbi:MAG TPA: response regulator [Xanthobacteraceae bacterium]|nr:response regulator [Xanthobacteraceae bacterium]